ncbi:MAG: prephenate dehydrogenase [Bacillota bacterium]|nr:prephenate dehydrogenase [Bacillota bacterium]
MGLDLTDFNVTIIGLGLIGGSYAMAIKNLKPKNLWGVDISEETIKEAEAMGIITKGFTKDDAPLADSDLVIIALYPEATIKFLKANKENFKDGAVITDVAGIKERLVEEVAVIMPDTVDFVPGHPMAGKESKGLKFASEKIFHNANYIITPTDKNKEENVKLVEDLAKGIGCKNVVKISAKKHDEIIAFTSDIPHAIAVSLVNSDTFNEETNLFIGGSFRDATRVAMINSSLWTELLIANGENVVKQLSIFEEKIKAIKEAVESKDKEGLEEIFQRANNKRRGLV